MNSKRNYRLHLPTIMEETMDPVIPWGDGNHTKDTPPNKPTRSFD